MRLKRIFGIGPGVRETLDLLSVMGRSRDILIISTYEKWRMNFNLYRPIGRFIIFSWTKTPMADVERVGHPELFVKFSNPESMPRLPRAMDYGNCFLRIYNSFLKSVEHWVDVDYRHGWILS